MLIESDRGNLIGVRLLVKGLLLVDRVSSRIEVVIEIGISLILLRSRLPGDDLW